MERVNIEAKSSRNWRFALAPWIFLLSAQAQTLPGPADWATTGPDGKIWLVGTTSARDLPTTPGVLQPRPGWDTCPAETDCRDLFIARVSSGGQLEKLTYLGGEGFDSSEKITLSADGRTLYLILFSNSERLLGRTIDESDYTFAVGLNADLDRALFLTPLPKGLSSSSSTFAPDGMVWAVEESIIQEESIFRYDNHLASFDPITGRLTRVQLLKPEPDRRISFQSVFVAPDGDIYVHLSHFSFGERYLNDWTLSRYSRDGRTEIYRRIVPGFYGTPTAGGVFWFGSPEDDHSSRLGRVLPSGVIEYFASIPSGSAPYRFFPRGVNELWFSGSTAQALRTADQAPRHCRVKAQEGYLGRLLLNERRIDYLAFTGRTQPADALWLQPESNGARLLTTSESTRLETLTIGPAGPAPFCLDANPDNLALAGLRRGDGAGLCFGTCTSDGTDPSLLAPGQMIALAGRGLGPTTASKPAPGTLPRTLAGTRLLLDGTPLALLSVSEDRIDAVLPYTFQPGATPKFTVERNSAMAGNTTVKILESNPEAFAGPRGGRAFRPDGTEVTGDDLVRPGDRLTAYLSGAGRWLQDDVDESRPVDRTLRPALPIRAIVNGKEATVEYAGQVTGLLPGILQVNVRLPDYLQGGTTRLDIYSGTSRFAPIWLNAAIPDTPTQSLK